MATSDMKMAPIGGHICTLIEALGVPQPEAMISMQVSNLVAYLRGEK